MCTVFEDNPPGESLLRIRRKVLKLSRCPDLDLRASVAGGSLGFEIIKISSTKCAGWKFGADVKV